MITFPLIGQMPSDDFWQVTRPLIPALGAGKAAIHHRASSAMMNATERGAA
jgi:hypothetical protein